MHRTILTICGCATFNAGVTDLLFAKAGARVVGCDINAIRREPSSICPSGSDPQIAGRPVHGCAHRAQSHCPEQGLEPDSD
jgi:hypothetical protein